jgi:hypothetical protein
LVLSHNIIQSEDLKTLRETDLSALLELVREREARLERMATVLYLKLGSVKKVGEYLERSAPWVRSVLEKRGLRRRGGRPSKLDIEREVIKVKLPLDRLDEEVPRCLYHASHVSCLGNGTATLSLSRRDLLRLLSVFNGGMVPDYLEIYFTSLRECPRCGAWGEYRDLCRECASSIKKRRGGDEMKAQQMLKKEVVGWKPSS